MGQPNGGPKSVAATCRLVFRKCVKSWAAQSSIPGQPLARKPRITAKRSMELNPCPMLSSNFYHGSRPSTQATRPALRVTSAARRALATATSGLASTCSRSRPPLTLGQVASVPTVAGYTIHWGDGSERTFLADRQPELARTRMHRARMRTRSRLTCWQAKETTFCTAAMTMTRSEQVAEPIGSSGNMATTACWVDRAMTRWKEESATTRLSLIHI